MKTETQNELLLIANELKEIVSFATECHDLRMSDLAKMDGMVYRLSNLINARRQDSDNCGYDDLVLWDDPRAFFPDNEYNKENLEAKDSFIPASDR